MSSDVLDLAIVCVNAAEKFIEKDPRFEIVGVCVENSDIFVTKSGVTPKKIGVTQNKKYQEQIVKDRFGNKCEIVPMLGRALPYALENNLVDGVILDVTKGWMLNGVKDKISVNRDYVTYVLLVRNDFKKNPVYKKFITAYKKSVKELESEDVLLEELKGYVNISITERWLSEWRRWNINLVPIIPQTNLVN
ncbi:hypothetical protein KTC93_04745 [Clostridium tagluense]|nr:ABC transporter substrate-binding (seleno)protein SaoB [Clostridium tagluense]MBW9158783.1 hypothetical protein [Clostridium tagluense]WLC66514.1 hypothetical protein KTC93_04745 [Clostridium tagluense]